MVWDVTEYKLSAEEIKKRVKELEDFYDMAVDRELRMKELKEEMKELKEELEKNKKNDDLLIALHIPLFSKQH